MKVKIISLKEFLKGLDICFRCGQSEYIEFEIEGLIQ